MWDARAVEVSGNSCLCFSGDMNARAFKIPGKCVFM
jgi:hypothetical protein